MKKWIVRWTVSGFVTKREFKTKTEAWEYYKETINTFGNDWYIEIDMWEVE